MKSNLSTFGREFSGEGLRKAREAAGMTQSQLAKAACRSDTSPKKIGMMEDGKRIPTALTVLSMSRVLGCSLEDIAPKIAK